MSNIARTIASVSVAAFLGSAGHIDPKYAANITVYHVNPASAPDVPVNMDTGDRMGDLNFFLPEFFLPLACADPDSRAKFDCDNPERTDPNLVVTKVEMDVDSRYTNYSACNVCTGIDPFSGRPCEKGAYVCDCQGAFCDPVKVGKTAANGHYECHTGWFHQSKAWDCWGANVDAQVPGLWYSHNGDGQCNKTNSACGWQVTKMETVAEQCMKEHIMAVVEHAGPECFSQCGQRNQTSSCWINCFFSTVLGPKSKTSLVDVDQGMPIADVADAWDNAFLPVAQGGCPRVKFGLTVVV